MKVIVHKDFGTVYAPEAEPARLLAVEPQLPENLEALVRLQAAGRGFVARRRSRHGWREELCINPNSSALRAYADEEPGWLQEAELRLAELMRAEKEEALQEAVLASPCSDEGSRWRATRFERGCSPPALGLQETMYHPPVSGGVCSRRVESFEPAQPATTPWTSLVAKARGAEMDSRR